MSMTQLFRPAGFRCAYDETELALVSMTGHEQISAPYRFTVELVSEDHDIDLDKLMGQPGCVRLAMGSGFGGSRYFHGIIARCRQMPPTDRHSRYQAELMPSFWLLSRTSDCRIFQDMDIPEIIAEIFRKHGIADYRMSLTASYDKKEYCVQYNETDFDFVSRLMEQEGIYYFFEHDPDKHIMVLADSKAAYEPMAAYETVEWNPHIEDTSVAQKIRDWHLEKELQSSAVMHRDYDFLRPRTDLSAAKEIRRPHASNGLEIFEYPGGYVREDVGERYARIRIEELQNRYQTVNGQSDARGLVAGRVFAMSRFPRKDQNKTYLLTRISHQLTLAEYASGAPSAAGSRLYECHFSAIDAEETFRPPRTTPRPLIRGPQTATVVGPKNEEIHVDDHGRVKVHFHWDRHDKWDAQSSCWIRVSQPWAGKGFGCMNVPRIHQEVIVEFLDGDPDRPIINGRVYNGINSPHASNAGRDGKKDNKKPSGVSKAAMMTSFKSNSLGGSGGHNEITMNDEGGKEGLFIKAQKDEIHTVGNDREDTVGNNEIKKIGNSQSIEIAVEAKEQVGMNKTVIVKDNLVLAAGKSITLKCGAGTIHMNQAGLISITGTIVMIGGAITTDITAPITTISGLALLQSGVISVNSGAFTNIIGGVTVIDGSPVKIN